MQKLIDIINLLKHGPYDITTDNGRVSERNRRIAITALTGAVSKLFAMGIPLFTVRITYAYLGEEIYGLWSAVTSFFALFQFADLGLGNGLKTRLSQSYGNEDKEQSVRLISSTYFVLLIVSIIIMTAFLIIYPYIDWAELMNAETEKAVVLAGGVVFAIVASRILNIPLALVERTQMALQEGYKSNLWQTLAYILSLIAVLLFSKLDLGPLQMIWASSMVVVIVSGINMIVYFFHQKRDYAPSLKKIDLKTSKIMLRSGFAFFVLSILTTVGLALDNFIVARTVSLSDAAVYSILYKVTHMIGGVTTMLSAPLWAANGEAYARNDFAWIRKSTKKMSLLLLSMSLLASLVLVLISKPFFKIWIGSNFQFNIILLIGLCIMQMLLSGASPFFMILNAFGKVKVQIIMFAIYTPISFFLKYFLSVKFGAEIIPWAGVFSYSIVIIPFLIYFTNKQVN